MNQMAFISLTSLVVFGMFVLGWIAGSIYQNLKRGSYSNPKAIDRLTKALVATEAERDRSIQAANEFRARMSEELSLKDESYRQTIDQLRDAERIIDQLEHNPR